MSVKVTLPQQNNIFVINNNFSTLEEISKSGFYIYKFKYLIDPAHWVFSKKGTRPTTLLINISRNKSTATKISLFNDNTDNFASNLRKYTSKQKDLIKQKEDQNIIWTYRSDFTKNIPNNMLKDIQEHSVLSSDTKLVLSRNIKTVTMLVSDIKNNKQVLPNLQVNTSINNEEPFTSISQRKIKNTRMELLYKSKLDPASVFGMKTNSFISPTRALHGTVLNLKTFGKLDNHTKIVSKNKDITNLVNNTEKLTLLNKNGRSASPTFGFLNKIKNISKEKK